MSRIVAKRYLGRMPVYNMEVFGLHNFVTAFGTVLHNCDAVRYYCISRVLPAEVQAEKEEALWDDDEDEQNDYNEFMTGGDMSASYLSM